MSKSEKLGITQFSSPLANEYYQLALAYFKKSALVQSKADSFTFSKQAEVLFAAAARAESYYVTTELPLAKERDNRSLNARNENTQDSACLCALGAVQYSPCSCQYGCELCEGSSAIEVGRAILAFNPNCPVHSR